MDLISILLLIFLTLLLLWKLSSKPLGFPPGPFRWPIIGNLYLTYGQIMHKLGYDLAKQHGELVGIYLGLKPMIFVSGLDAIKEASNREDLSGRPIVNFVKGVNKGILMNFGEVWKEQRRFALHNLRNLGFGKQSMQGIIQEEAQTLINEIKKYAGEGYKIAVPLYDILGTSGINVLWHIMSGQRYSHDDKEFQKLISAVKNIVNISSAAGHIATYFPLLAKIFPSIDKVDQAKKPVFKFIKDEIDKHKKNLDMDNPNDFIDIYLVEISKQLNNYNTSFTDEQLLEVCWNLFAAGTDTTLNTLIYAFGYMVKYPEVQAKVQEELDGIIGRDRLPELNDRANLIYTEATILEASRMSTIVPLAVPHAPLEANKDINFRGYIIPKDSRVLLNLAQLHNDPNIWKDPENFRPERFIQNNKVIRHEALMPFGYGKRQCLGETLAKNNVFLFFTSVMQKYKLMISDNDNDFDLKPHGGFTIHPKPFNTKIKPRYLF